MEVARSSADRCSSRLRVASRLWSPPPLPRYPPRPGTIAPADMDNPPSCLGAWQSWHGAQAHRFSPISPGRLELSAQFTASKDSIVFAYRWGKGASREVLMALKLRSLDAMQHNFHYFSADTGVFPVSFEKCDHDIVTTIELAVRYLMEWNTSKETSEITFVRYLLNMANWNYCVGLLHDPRGALKVGSFARTFSEESRF